MHNLFVKTYLTRYWRICKLMGENPNHNIPYKTDFELSSFGCFGLTSPHKAYFLIWNHVFLQITCSLSLTRESQSLWSWSVVVFHRWGDVQLASICVLAATSLPPLEIVSVIKILINDKFAHTPPLFPLPLVPVYPAVFLSVSDSCPSHGLTASPWPSSAQSAGVQRGCELSHSNILAIGILFRLCVASSGWFLYPCQILVIHTDLTVFLPSTL